MTGKPESGWPGIWGQRGAPGIQPPGLKGSSPLALHLVWDGGGGGGSLVPEFRWFWGLAAAVTVRERDVPGVIMSVYMTKSEVSSSAAVLMGQGVSVPYKQTNKRLPPETAWGPTC